MSRFKTLGFVIFCLAILLAFTPAAMAATTWTVENGESIQDAIDSASPGDTILVEPGTYKEEPLTVNKSLTIEGTGTGVVVRSQGTGNDIVMIVVSNVTLRSLVFDGENESKTALDIYGDISNIQVRNCTFRDVDTGLWINYTMGIVVANNTFENVRDYGIDSEGPDPLSSFRVLSIGNRFVFDPGTDPSWTAHYAGSRLGNIAFFNTFENYEGHIALGTPDVEDYLFNAQENYWGDEDVQESDIQAACSAKVLYSPWSFADAAGHTDYQFVPVGGSAVFDVGASEGITVSIEEMTTQPPPALPLALAAYGHKSPRATTVQDDNPGADTYTAYFHLKDVESGPGIAGSPVRMTLEIPKSAIGDEADLDDLVLYAYDSGAWGDITGEEWINVEVDGDIVRIVVDNYGDPVPIAITAGNGHTSSGGCSSTGAASLGLLFLVPFGLLFGGKK